MFLYRFKRQKLDWYCRINEIVFLLLFIICVANVSEANELKQKIKELSGNSETLTSTAPSTLQTTGQKKTNNRSSKKSLRKKSTVKKVADPGVDIGLAEKLQQKLNGKNEPEKTTKKSVSGVPVTINILEEMKTKIRNPSGFRYAISPFGTPSIIKADDLSNRSTPVSDPKVLSKTVVTGKDQAAREFLRNNKNALKLEDPDKELELSKSTTDELGITRHRYQQRFNGVTVWGRELSIYENNSGAINLFNGNYRPTPVITDMTPAITPSEAIQKVITDLDLKSADVTKQNATLVIWYDEPIQTDHLVWHIEIAAGDSVYWHYFVDAKSGTIRNRYSGIMNGSAVPASGVDLKGVTQNFTAWQQNGLYYMIDVTRPINDGAISLIQKTGDIWITNLQTGNISSSISSSSGWNPAAVSIMTNVYAVLDYFKNTHGLIGYSSNQQNIQVRINGSASSSGYPNTAFFSGQDYTMNFGLGDGSVFSNLAGGLDVVAHEFTHGVVESTANLVYQYQSGALNESFADFFAAMIDRDDWVMGEDVFLRNGGVMRDMRYPHSSYVSQPTKMSELLRTTEDHGGVHTNSGIPNRAAWLVAEGLTTEGSGIGIGKVKTEKIWYRALSTYLHPNDRFLEARRATIQAAIDLYGDSSEVMAVRTAWDQVEVFDSISGTSSTNNPTSTDPLLGTDWLITVFNGGIYLQTPSGGYGPLNTVIARDIRPSVVVGTTDTFILYVDDVVNDLRIIDLATLTDTLFDNRYFYWSVAIPQNAGKIAYTKQEPEPYIYVVDYQDLNEKPYLLAFQTDGGTSVGSIQYADTMSFDFTGRKIVFDAINTVSNPGLPTYSNMTIGILDLEQGVVTAPLPPQEEGVNIGNPVFATNNNFVIAFDYYDLSTYENGIISYNLSANLEDNFGLIAYSGSTDQFNFWQPFFNGTDNAVTFRYEPISGNSSIKSIPIIKSGNSWGGNQTAMTPFSASPGNYPLLFRNSPRIIDARITVSTTTLDFGTMISGAASKKTFTVQNTGNIDLTLKDMQLNGSGFTHNGTLGLLPRNSSMTIEVNYVASETPGTKNGSLTITSDAASPYNSLTVNFSAINATPAQYTVTPTSGNGFTVDPAVAQTVLNNSNTSFTITPSSGYGISSVSGCGGSLSGNTYTTGAITSNCTISVEAIAKTATAVAGTSPTISDALKAFQAALGITPISGIELIRYDVAPLSFTGTPVGNGVIDGADVIMILRRSIGIGSW